MHEFHCQSAAKCDKIGGDFCRTGKSRVEKTQCQAIIQIIEGVIKRWVSEIDSEWCEDNEQF